MEKQRIYFIDYIKAFSISLIIISHCIGWFSINDVVNRAILSIHVPVFFVAIGFLKGLLRKDEDLATFIKKRSRQLLIPYLWFSIYNSAVKLSMMAIGIGGAISMDVLKEEAVAFFITGNGTVWFLMTLFMAESLFVWLRTFKNNWLLVVVAVVLTVIPFMWNSNNPFLIVLGRAMTAYSLIVLGLFASYLLKFKKPIAVLTAVLFVVWLWFVYNTGWDYSFFDGCFNSIEATMSVIICGCLAICLLLSFCSKKYDYLQYIGKNSMVLMLVHPTFLLIGIYGLYPRLHLHGNIQFVLFSIILTIVVYGLSLLCVPLIHNYLPFMIGEKKKTGK